MKRFEVNPLFDEHGELAGYAASSGEYFRLDEITTVSCEDVYIAMDTAIRLSKDDGVVALLNIDEDYHFVVY